MRELTLDWVNNYPLKTPLTGRSICFVTLIQCKFRPKPCWGQLVKLAICKTIDDWTTCKTLWNLKLSWEPLCTLRSAEGDTLLEFTAAPKYGADLELFPPPSCFAAGCLADHKWLMYGQIAWQLPVSSKTTMHTQICWERCTTVGWETMKTSCLNSDVEECSLLYPNMGQIWKRFHLQVKFFCYWTDWGCRGWR